MRQFILKLVGIVSLLASSCLLLIQVRWAYQMGQLSVIGAFGAPPEVAAEVERTVLLSNVCLLAAIVFELIVVVCFVLLGSGWDTVKSLLRRSPAAEQPEAGARSQPIEFDRLPKFPGT
jgi:hypothetical protein